MTQIKRSFTRLAIQRGSRRTGNQAELTELHLGARSVALRRISGRTEAVHNRASSAPKRTQFDLQNRRWDTTRSRYQPASGDATLATNQAEHDQEGTR